MDFLIWGCPSTQARVVWTVPMLLPDPNALHPMPGHRRSAFLAVAWWGWPIDRIMRNLDAIGGAEIAALERAR